MTNSALSLWELHVGMQVKRDGQKLGTAPPRPGHFWGCTGKTAVTEGALRRAPSTSDSSELALALT